MNMRHGLSRVGTAKSGSHEFIFTHSHIHSKVRILTALEAGRAAGLVSVYRLTAPLGVVLIERPGTLSSVAVAV